nr:uncharacterized protein LOC119180963 [Rhipicephalus microplus]
MTCIRLGLPVLLLFIRSSRSVSTENVISANVPFEDNLQYDCYQYAEDALNITGKIYVIVQNFNSTLPPLCDSAEVVKRENNTYYVATLAAVIPILNRTLVKFNTSLVLSKTGNHSKYNAMTYKYTTQEPPKLRKLMYLSPSNECMIFVDDRNSTDQARCQLLMPWNHANYSIPEDCQAVYNSSCAGKEQLRVYHPWCQSLPEIPLEVLMKRLNTTPAPAQC